MALRHSMRDMIILIPGIMGSVLEQRGNELWSMPRIIGPGLLGNTAVFQPLYLIADHDADPERELLPDGVRATRLMTGIHGIHGLMLGEGYQQISDTILRTFDVVLGSRESDAPANFFHLPYDWRRDNRAAAHRLKRLLDTQLPRWQAATTTAARVILIGHSMGGLVARYYLEALGGWEHCRALFTFGTPHRGSLNALDSLCNKHTLGAADLTELVRSFSSAYQLLPIYPSIWVGDRLCRAAEMEALPDVDHQRVAAGRAFHLEIKDYTAKRHPELSIRIYPIAGTHQPTSQSAFLTDTGKVEISANLPKELPANQDSAWIRDGDGTVPYLAALPIEPPKVQRRLRYAEKHAWLPNNRRALDDLCQELVEMQLDDYIQEFEGELGVRANEPALSLNLPNLHLGEQPLRVSARIENQLEDPEGVLLTLASADTGAVIERELEAIDGGWGSEFTNLPSGVYTVTLQTYAGGPLAPQAVHDVLEIVA